MKSTLLLVAILAAAYEPAIQYFARTRTVNVTASDRQNYLVVDSDVWKFSRPDLSDLRLYDGQSQVPYALVKQSGGSSSEESAARILNLGKVGDHTEFDLDVRRLNEYGRIRLQLDAKNFINSARVHGRNDLNDRAATALGSGTLYDFSAESLGSNSTLKFPQSSFPYLHVRLAPGINPGQVKGAYVSNFSETKSAWTPAGTCTPSAAASRQSVFTCSIAKGMPVERLTFDLPAATVSFNREVSVSDGMGNRFERGSISRVRINRAGRSVVSEELSLDLYSRPAAQLKIIVENGDDTPLPIQQVRPLSVERRIYFDPKGKTTLKLYYGDAKVGAPSYDYQKFFQPAGDAAVAQLNTAAANSQFTGRPDDRPWSERHNSLLWIAMVFAVGILGALALRGLRKTDSVPS